MSLDVFKRVIKRVNRVGGLNDDDDEYEYIAFFCNREHTAEKFLVCLASALHDIQRIAEKESLLCQPCKRNQTVGDLGQSCSLLTRKIRFCSRNDTA